MVCRAQTQKASCSPTAIALGSSAIVKVSGQNCFRTLYGSLGQIRLGPPKGSAEGSTKVPPMLFKFRGVSGSGADLSRAAKRFRGPPRFQQGCTKIPPRFLKFRGVSGSLGQIRLGLPKGSV